MLPSMIAEYMDMSVEDVEQLMAIPQRSIYRDARYLGLIASLDLDQLEKALPEVRMAYDDGLDYVSLTLKRNYKLNMALTAYTMSDWLLHCLKNPQRLSEMTAFNALVPGYALWDTLPLLIRVLDDLPLSIRREWQRALALLLFPLAETTN